MLYARFGVTVDNPDRLVPLDLYLARRDGGPLTAGAWSRVKLGAIEHAANRSELGAAIRGRLHMPGPLLRTAAAFFASSFGTRDRQPLRPHWAADMMWSQIDESIAPAAEAPPDQAPSVTSTWITTEVDATLPVEVKGSPEFFAAVADTYRELVAVTRAPAQPMADANGVPVTTVYYWIRQARELGYLAPGTRGKAG